MHYILPYRQRNKWEMQRWGLRVGRYQVQRRRRANAVNPLSAPVRNGEIETACLEGWYVENDIGIVSFWFGLISRAFPGSD